MRILVAFETKFG